MNIFFDVDYTILAMDGSLRPGTAEVMQQLAAGGHSVFVWSGVGVRGEEVRRHGLQGYVSGVFQKPLQNFESGLATLGIPVRPDFVVDDYPEIVSAFGGVVVRPYYFPVVGDDEIRRVYEVVVDYVMRGRCHQIPEVNRSLPRHYHGPSCRAAYADEMPQTES